MTKALSLDYTERFVLMIGLLKLLAVVAFFTSFAFMSPPAAFATEATACTGQNLLVKLQNEDPAGYEQVLKEARQIENSQSKFWKVEKAGVQDSYVFGTMHLADPKIATLSQSVKSALLKTDTVIIETLDVLDPQKAQQAMAGLAHLTLLSQGSLRDLVNDELEDELADAVEARGIPMALADRMQPWLIATTISIPVCEIARKQSGEKVLDSVIAAEAQKAGKKLKGLETAAEQLQALASLPVDYHVSALEETLASGELATDMIQTLKETYIAGDMGVVFPLMRVALPKSSNGDGAAEFQEALIKKRNITMVERSLPELEQGSVFMAVGALHLPDTTGIVSMLRKHGFTVTAIE